MEFDIFFSISQTPDSTGYIPTEQEMFRSFFDQVELADKLGFGVGWVAQAHLSTEVQKMNKKPVVPHYPGEVGLCTDFVQIAREMFLRTEKMEVGSAVMSILASGGPIAHAERIGAFLTLHGMEESEKRRLHIGYSAGRFEFMARPYGIVPRNEIEEVAWPALRGQIFAEASEIFLRLLNGEVISSKDIRKTVLTRDNFYTEEDWKRVQEVAKKIYSLDSQPREIEIPRRYQFEQIKTIPQDWRSELLNIVIGSHDKKLQIGIHALKHHSNWGEIGSSLTDLADISIQHLLQQVSKEFKIKHGRVKGEEKAVLALGKAGSQEMTPTSDLDLIFIYRHNAENKKSNGNYPLSPSHYYTRLGQRLINAITAQTSEGSLYSVDMRLRPSGNSGPIASSLSAFEKYHEDKSWTWEHMALSRARVITGTPRLIKDIENIIKATLTRKRNNEKLRMDVSSMRLLIDKKHQSDVIWDTKYIRGGLIDIEFIVQYLQLKNAHDNPNILATNTSDALKILAKEKILTNMQIGKLNDALKLWQTIQGILRLPVQGFFRPKPEQEVPKALAQVMIDATGCSDIRELESRIIVSAKDVYEIYKNLIGNPIKTSSNEAS